MNQYDVVLDVKYEGTLTKRVYAESSDEAVTQAMSDPTGRGLVMKSMTHSVSYITQL